MLSLMGRTTAIRLPGLAREINAWGADVITAMSLESVRAALASPR
jgi:hypothetical protein